MSDLISRSAFAEEIESLEITVAGKPARWYDAKHSVLRCIAEAPAVDAVEVVYGRWVDHGVRDWRCSKCGEKVNKVRNVDGYCYDDKPNYCPNCGAKMDGGKAG